MKNKIVIAIKSGETVFSRSDVNTSTEKRTRKISAKTEYHRGI